MNRCNCRRCRGCNFERSLQNPAGFADLAVSKFALAGLAVVDVAVVGAAAAADKTWSKIPFVLLLHTDRVLPDYAAAVAVVDAVAAAAVVGGMTAVSACSDPSW